MKTPTQNTARRARRIKWSIAVIAALALSSMLLEEAMARGRGGGGRGGAGRGRRGGGRTGGVGRGRSVRFILSRRSNGSADGAKEWEVLLEQEARKQQIMERRNALMDADRKAEQEAHLEAERGKAADAAGRDSVIR